MELSFGEQIKIILKRKNMTIKDLAALYEEQTNNKMSRQNLTQRLKRDNFPEQDMHIIAALLGYHVSVQLTPATVPLPEFVHTASAAPERPVTPVQTLGPVSDTVSASSPHEPASSSSASPGPSSMTFQIPDAFRRNRTQGEINPFTGEEYLTNTVRRHPDMDEFVQVYDQSTHTWSDVQEDYFWEFQERKKQMMGKDYQAPILI